MKRTLLLNIDYRPFDIISWRRAFYMYFAEPRKANVLHYHEDVIRDGKGNEYNIPSVMILTHYREHNLAASYSKSNILLRDNYKCQYCHKVFDGKDLTVDHVIPRAIWKKEKRKGSPSVFENVVACCKICNSLKGDKTLEKAGMRLFKQPKKVNRTQILTAKISHSHHPEDWKLYLNV